jgi:thymidylate kinase
MMMNKQLAELFYLLKSNGIEYAFLRSYEEFIGNYLVKDNDNDKDKDKDKDKDIDIVLNWKDLNRFESILFDIFMIDDLLIYKQGAWETANQYLIWDVKTKEKIILDVRRDYTYKGRVLISNKYLIKDIKDYKNLKILNKSIETEMLIYHVYFKNRNKQKYIDRLRTLDCVDEGLINKLSKQEASLSDLLVFFPRLKKSLAQSTSIYEKLGNKIKSFFQLAKPLTIVLLGPDGAGKSTVGKNIEGLLEEIGVGSDYFHFALGKKSLYKKNIPVAVINKQREELKNKIPFVFLKMYRILMFIKRELVFTSKFVKYNKNYVSNIFCNSKKKKISIIDRFPLNTCINKNKLRYESLWRRMTKVFILHPTIIYFLHADAEIIFKRKQELTEDEIECFMDYEIKLIESIKINYKVIDVSGSVDNISLEIVRDILHRFKNKIPAYIWNNK